MKLIRTVTIAISIILLCMPLAYVSEGNNQILNRINSFESQGMEDWFKTTIIFGRIANLSEERDFTSFEAVRLRYIQFNPFSVRLFNSQEQLTIKNKYLGWMSSSRMFGIFKATTEKFEYEIILDALNDVINLEGEIVNYPNIDIKELTYARVDRKVILTVEVNGEIENLGNLTGLDDMVTYSLILTTSYDQYCIMYINNLCILLSSQGEENITDFSVTESILEVNFNLNNTDEIYNSLEGDSMFFSIMSGLYYIDTVGVPLEVYADIPNLGEVGTPVEFYGFALFGTPPYTWFWDFDDGYYSSEKNPTHTYTEPGEYNVTLTVTDNVGAKASTNGTIEIYPNYTINSNLFEVRKSVYSILDEKTSFLVINTYIPCHL